MPEPSPENQALARERESREFLGAVHGQTETGVEPEQADSESTEVTYGAM